MSWTANNSICRSHGIPWPTHADKLRGFSGGTHPARGCPSWPRASARPLDCTESICFRRLCSLQRNLISNQTYQEDEFKKTSTEIMEYCGRLIDVIDEPKCVEVQQGGWEPRGTSITPGLLFYSSGVLNCVL